MDEQNYTPQEQPTAVEPVVASVPRRHFPWLAVIITVVATALILGGGGYFLYAQKVSLATNDADQKIKTAEEARDKVTNDLTACEANRVSLTDEVKKINDEVKKRAEEPYQGWQNYVDSKFSSQWKYPADWKVVEKVEQPGPVFKKNGFCLHFTSPQNVLLNVCYRLTTDDDSTTWFRTGLSYGELAKVGVNIKMASKVINQKTYYGQDGEVFTIIYGQNFQEDETGYGARMKIGDYYFTAMADDLNHSSLGITSEDQVVMEKILASLQWSATAQAPAE